MKLSISNIAWSQESDLHMMDYLVKSGFSGLEIAPTRVIPENPYSSPDKIIEFKTQLKNHNLELSSMQSIWYGCTEKIFGSQSDRNSLINYTKKAIDFANTLQCKNLVFGSPKNRSYQNSEDIQHGVQFFNEISDYAFKNNTIIALEANPIIYNTNFINTTQQAIEYVREINNPGLKINLDFGTIIQNNETLEFLEENIDLINHIHISEPYLEVPQKRELHQQLASILESINYSSYVSIEMKNPGELKIVKNTMQYVKELFNGS